VAGAAWRAVTRIVAGVGDLVQRIGDGHTGQILGGRAILRWPCYVKFMAIPSYAYLRLKMPRPARVITVEAKT
jgi:hypothetical protein